MDNQPNSQTPPPAQHMENNADLWARTRLAILVVGVFILTIIGKTCSKRKENNPPGQEIQIKNSPRSVSVPKCIGQCRISPVVGSYYVPPEGSITITPKDKTKSIDDLVKIHYQEIGWTFEPGIEFSGNLYYSYGIDAKLLFAWRLGLGIGLVGGSNVATIICPDMFISYRLDQLHLRNTEAIVTYVPASKIPFGLGVRINL